MKEGLGAEGQLPACWGGRGAQSQEQERGTGGGEGGEECFLVPTLSETGANNTGCQRDRTRMKG